MQFLRNSYKFWLFKNCNYLSVFQSGALRGYLYAHKELIETLVKEDFFLKNDITKQPQVKLR